MMTKAENGVEPLQLPEDPEWLKLDEAKFKPEASTKKLAPSLSTTESRGTRYHVYPVPPLTTNTEAAKKAKPSQLHEQHKMDEAELDAKASTTTELVPSPNTTENRGTHYHGHPNPSTTTNEDEPHKPS